MQIQSLTAIPETTLDTLIRQKWHKIETLNEIEILHGEPIDHNELETLKAELKVLKAEQARRIEAGKDTRFRDLIRELSEELAEHRSDISDILSGFLEGSEYYLENWKESIESRYASARLPDEILRDEYRGTRVEYDTLTTLLFLNRDNGDLTQLEAHQYE